MEDISAKYYCGLDGLVSTKGIFICPGLLSHDHAFSCTHSRMGIR